MSERVVINVNESDWTPRRFLIDLKIKLSEFQELIHRVQPSHIGKPEDQHLFLGTTELCYGVATGDKNKTLRELGIGKGFDIELSVCNFF